MTRIILLTFIQRDSIRSMHPALWQKCLYLGTGKVSKNQYTWRYSTTSETALALRLMGLCSVEEYTKKTSLTSECLYNQENACRVQNSYK